MIVDSKVFGNFRRRGLGLLNNTNSSCLYSGEYLLLCDMEYLSGVRHVGIKSKELKEWVVSFNS